MNELYETLRLYTNFFLPVMKLKKRIRVGSKVKKVYDKPTTSVRFSRESTNRQWCELFVRQYDRF